MDKCRICGAVITEKRKKPLTTCPKCRARFGSAAQRAKKKSFERKC